MAGAARTDLLVGGVGAEAVDIAHRRGDHARGLPELALHAPEAAHGEDCDGQPLGEGPLQGLAGDEVDRRRGQGIGPAGQGGGGGGHVGGLAQEDHAGLLQGGGGGA